MGRRKLVTIPELFANASSAKRCRRDVVEPCPEPFKQRKRKRCAHPDCSRQPYYNFEGQAKALYCAQHKEPDMVDVKHKRCKTPLCDTHVTNTKYRGHCLRCFMHLFPDEPVSRNYKTKEWAVSEFVRTAFPHYSWVCDRKIADGCSSRRPDLLLDLGDQVLVVEVDENQHVLYDCSCENKRLMQLSRDVGNRPLVVVRFNPDSYMTSSGNTVTSCWGPNKLGISVVKKSKSEEWAGRLESLREQISYWIEPTNRSDRTVTVVELFYDEL